MLHRVTLGGAGKRHGGKRHPSIGNGVLLGAGATLLGAIDVGEGANVGASSLVIADVPANAVAVGVPAKIIMRKSNGETSTLSPASSMDTAMVQFDI
jgi:serine O-acetyltransferase